MNYKLKILFLLAIVVFLGCQENKRPLIKTDSDVYIPVYGIDKILRLNPNTYQITDTLRAGKNPHDFVFSPDANFIYAVQKEEMPTNSLWQINRKTGNKIKEIPVGSISHHLAINGDGSKLYVATNDLVMVETGDLMVSKLIDGEKIVCVVAGNQGIFANDFAAQSIYRLDPSTNNVTDTLKPAGHPLHNKLSPNGNRLFVTLWSPNPKESGLKVYDTRTNKEEAFVETGADAADLDVSPDGKNVYVTNTNEGLVYKIDLTTYKVLWKQKIPAARSITVSRDGKKVFVGPMGHNTLYILNAASGALLHSVDLGGQPGHAKVLHQ